MTVTFNPATSELWNERWRRISEALFLHILNKASSITHSCISSDAVGASSYSVTDGTHSTTQKHYLPVFHTFIMSNRSTFTQGQGTSAHMCDTQSPPHWLNPSASSVKVMNVPNKTECIEPQATLFSPWRGFGLTESGELEVWGKGWNVTRLLEEENAIHSMLAPDYALSAERQEPGITQVPVRVQCGIFLVPLGFSWPLSEIS